FDILRIEIDRFIVRDSVKNAADVQLRIDRVNCSLQDDPVPYLPAILTSQRVVDDYPLAFSLPRCNLIGRYCNIPEHLEKFIWIVAKLSKKVFQYSTLKNSYKQENGTNRM